MPKAKDKYIVITLRITPTEKDIIATYAKEERRSVHNYIRHRLKLTDSIFPRLRKKGGTKNGE